MGSIFEKISLICSIPRETCPEFTNLFASLISTSRSAEEPLARAGPTHNQTKVASSKADSDLTRGRCKVGPMRFCTDLGGPADGLPRTTSFIAGRQRYNPSAQGRDRGVGHTVPHGNQPASCRDLFSLRTSAVVFFPEITSPQCGQKRNTVLRTYDERIDARCRRRTLISTTSNRRCVARTAEVCGERGSRHRSWMDPFPPAPRTAQKWQQRSN